MSDQAVRATQWIYRGVWSVLTRWFRVPQGPPMLPVAAGDSAESFRPSPNFLRYLKLWFWLALLPIDVAILIGWIAVMAVAPWIGVALAPVALFLAVAPDVVVYVGLHLRFDTTWYVMTNRSLRLRRGVWVIQEVTITFENVQNVVVQQGPVQRFFGIANVSVETAGAGANPHTRGLQITNQGLIEGIGDPDRVRAIILARLRRSKTAGLGDEIESPDSVRLPFASPQHLRLLREIRDEVAAL